MAMSHVDDARQNTNANVDAGLSPFEDRQDPQYGIEPNASQAVASSPPRRVPTPPLAPMRGTAQ